MNCKVCNAELKEGQAFCAYCGTKVEAPSEQVVEPTVQEQISVSAPTEESAKASEPVGAQSEQQSVINAVPVYQSAQEENKKSPADTHALIGFILGICSLTLCCIGLPSGIIGVIFSAKGLKSRTRKGFAIPGLILSIAAIVECFSFWIGFTEGLLGEFAYELEDLSMILSNLF